MRRLAIFDPAHGHQPMLSPDGRFALVFNGALYNHEDLRVELEAKGWSFRTRCDTEVLLAALAHWGRSALPRLRGMFAFALWDAAERTLTAARDAFGIKPFYFHHSGHRFAFASEVKALLAGGLVAPEIDPSSVAEYLDWLAVPAPRTIYRHTHSLQPGESLVFRDGVLHIERWWNLKGRAAGASAASSREEFISGLRERLEDSIRAHMLADVPVGAFLSGGLDSAAVAALMSKLSGRALKTFCIGFGERGFSEAAEAEETARYIGASHHTRILTGRDVAADIEDILESCDQPTGDGINTYYASQAAREGGVKVALSGLGGDELFGGYPSFRDVPVLTRLTAVTGCLPYPLRRALSGVLGMGGPRGRKLADFVAFARRPHEVCSMQRRVFSVGARSAMLSRGACEALSGPAPFHPRLEALRTEIGTPDTFAMVSAWEMRTYMADVLLRDSDVMSMRQSLELRVPYIDRPLVEWVWGQPSAFKGDGGHPKSCLSEAVSDLLPPALLARRKRGFTLPFPLWMRGELRPFLEETFSEASIGRSGLFSAPDVRRLWSDFAASRQHAQWSRVWALAILVAFVNRRQHPQ